jgi:hypothetical protein
MRRAGSPLLQVKLEKNSGDLLEEYAPTEVFPIGKAVPLAHDGLGSIVCAHHKAIGDPNRKKGQDLFFPFRKAEKGFRSASGLSCRT